MTSQARIAAWVLALFAVLCVGAAVVGRLVLPSVPKPQASAHAAQRQREATAQRARAEDAKQALLKNGTMTRIDCQAHEVQADGLAWSLTTVETKRQAVQALSTICQIETGYARITVIDNRSGRKLAEFSGYSSIELY